jgi:hypothetical protein
MREAASRLALVFMPYFFFQIIMTLPLFALIRYPPLTAFSTPLLTNGRGAKRQGVVHYILQLLVASWRRGAIQPKRDPGTRD